MMYTVYNVHGLTLDRTENLDDAFHQGDGWIIRDEHGRDLYERRSFEYRDIRWYAVRGGPQVFPKQSTGHRPGGE